MDGKEAVLILDKLSITDVRLKAKELRTHDYLLAACHLKAGNMQEALTLKNKILQIVKRGSMVERTFVINLMFTEAEAVRFYNLCANGDVSPQRLIENTLKRAFEEEE